MDLTKQNIVQKVTIIFMSLIMLVSTFSSIGVSAHDGDHTNLEDLHSLYSFIEKNPDAQYKITDKKEIRENIRLISKIKDNELMKDINHKDLKDTHVTTQYSGKAWDKFNIHMSVFEFEGMDDGWALIVFYDVDRNKLIDMAKIQYSGENAEISNYLTGNTVDLSDELKEDETNEESISIMWHPPGEKDVWNDPNCKWLGVVYCGAMGFLTTPWGSIACGAGWTALCH